MPDLFFPVRSIVSAIPLHYLFIIVESAFSRKQHFYGFLLPAKEVAERQCFQACLSVSQSVILSTGCGGAGGVPMWPSSMMHCTSPYSPSQARPLEHGNHSPPPTPPHKWPWDLTVQGSNGSSPAFVLLLFTLSGNECFA